MVIHLDSELEAALIETAKARGITPDVLILNALRAQFVISPRGALSHEERMQLLRTAAVDCGVTLSDEDLSSDGLYN